MLKFIGLWVLVIVLFFAYGNIVGNTNKRPISTGEPNYTEVKTTAGRDGTDCPGVHIQVDGIYIYENRTELLLVWSNDNKGTTVTYGNDFVLEKLEDGQWVSCAAGDSSAIPNITDEIKGEDIENVSYLLTGFQSVNPEEAGLCRVVTTCTVRDNSGKEETCTLWAEFTLYTTE